MTVTKNDILKALRISKIEYGDILLVHSSLKSMGTVEGGSETVIRALIDSLGEEGTLVMPTLCQADFENAYRTWNIEKPSEVGLITETFRKMPNVLRSDQATHSVATYGKYAEEVTKTHGITGKRYGIFGDTPFSADSPWQKMYDMCGKVLFLGVTMKANTYRHFIEYVFTDKYLKMLEGNKNYDRLKGKLWCHDKWNEGGVWPHVNNTVLEEVLDRKGKITKALCGSATFMTVSIREITDTALQLIEKHPETFLNEEFREWMKEVEESIKRS